MIEILFTPDVPNQKFRVVLDGQEYTLFFKYNPRAIVYGRDLEIINGAWVVDLIDSSGDAIIAGMTVFPGWALGMSNTSDLETIPPQLIAAIDISTSYKPPAMDELGKYRRVRLVYDV